jgi:hypothetical protein
LEYWSTAAQRCASNFLNQNIHLFQDSGEARVFHYPIYPQDEERYAMIHWFLQVLTKARLLEGLAKLICTQEYVRRRNANSAESAREKVLHYPGYPALLIRAKRAREEKEDSIQEPDQSDSEQSEYARPPSSLASSIGSFHEDQDAMLVPIPIPYTQANINDPFQYSQAHRASPTKH